VRTLLLDIGGVFYLDHPDAAFWGRWAERAGSTPEEIQARFWNAEDAEAVSIGALSTDEFCRRAAPRLGLSPALVREMNSEAFLSGPNHAFVGFIQDVRRRGVPVSALTNTWSTEAAVRARPLFMGLFDCVISSCDVGVVKPDPRIFHLTLERLRSPPCDVVFVDDTIDNVEAGAAVGLHTVWFRDTAQAIADIEAALNDPGANQSAD
jgi:epoxide hydrolase-like predicted phosphatase